MRNLIRALTLVAVLAMTACGGGGDGDGAEAGGALSASIDVGDEFVLGFGETVDVGPLGLEFTGVTDERCATDGIIVCAWEGNAQVFLAATNGQTSQMLTLNTSPRYPSLVVFAGHIIELRRLDPQPRSHVHPAPDEYTATLFVDGMRVPAGG